MVHMTISAFQQWFEDNKEAVYERFFEFLRFPTVGTQSKHDQDMKDCAGWLLKELERIGLKAEEWKFPEGHSSIFGEKIVHPKSKTILFYHHYDVQPEDPIDLWKSPPFEPTVRGDNIYSRGAGDNKGLCAFTVAAVEAFLQMSQDHNFNIKMIIEGEEESGSPSLDKYIHQYSDRLKADYLLVVDMGMGSKEKPALTVGCRGIVSMEGTCRVSDTDLHSGGHGGIAANPIAILSKAIANIHDEKGFVQIEGFYDDVIKLTEEQKKEFDLEFDRARYQQEFGVRAFAETGEVNYSEINAFFPVIDVNGIWGGYLEEGFKTVLPAEAHFKLSSRIVPGQDPEDIYQKIAKFLKEQVPSGVELDINPHGHGYPYRADTGAPLAQMMKEAYHDVFQKPVFFHSSGGSIPITIKLMEASQAECIFPGTGLDTDNIHAPNEHFSYYQFEKGFEIIVAFLLRMKKATHSSSQ